MPLPAASAVYVRACVGSIRWVKWPSGGRASISSPTWSSVDAQVEKTPCGTRRIATRSGPSGAREQIE